MTGSKPLPMTPEDLLARCELIAPSAPAIDVYPGCVVVSMPFDSPRLASLKADGYSLCPVGRFAAMVIPCSSDASAARGSEADDGLPSVCPTRAAMDSP